VNWRKSMEQVPEAPKKLNVFANRPDDAGCCLRLAPGRDRRQATAAHNPWTEARCRRRQAAVIPAPTDDFCPPLAPVVTLAARQLAAGAICDTAEAAPPSRNWNYGRWRSIEPAAWRCRRRQEPAHERRSMAHARRGMAQENHDDPLAVVRIRQVRIESAVPDGGLENATLISGPQRHCRWRVVL